MAFDDGLVSGNKRLKKVEPLITPAQLRARWLYGIDIKDNAGRSLPDSTLQDYIDAAVAYVENYLDIKITPEEISETCGDDGEFHDYVRSNYTDWGYLHLLNIPVREIIKMEFVYQKDDSDDWVTKLEIPSQWIRLKQHSGIIRLVPNARFPGQLAVGASGIYYPDIFAVHAQIPLAWRVFYKFGFEDGRIPVLVNTAIGLIAAIHALNIAGDLVIGAGIASKSLNIDSLSDSINTTASAENHSYSAKVKEYQRLLFGKDTQFSKEKGIMGMLKAYYQGDSIEFL